MKLQTDEVGGILVLSTPDMDLDAGNAEEFKKSAAPLVDEHSKVTMDLGGINFMDSAGLGAVLSVFKKVRAQGGRFNVYGLSDEVRVLFDLVRMQRLFEVHPDRESAIKALESEEQAT